MERALIEFVDDDAGLAQLFDHGCQMLGPAAFYLDLAAGDRRGDYERTGLDAVGNDRVFGSAKRFDAVDLDDRRSGTFDAGAHLVKQFGKIVDLRLLRGVLDDRFAECERRGHHYILGACYGHLFKLDRVADEAALRGTGNHVARLERHDRTKLLERFQMQVDRARADSTTAGQADLCLAEPGEQRPESEYAGPHGFDQLVRGLKYLNIARVDLVRAQFRGKDSRPEILEQPPLSDQILYIRHVVQYYRFGRQQRRRETRQCRIFGSADLDLSAQRIAAANLELIHNYPDLRLYRPRLL